LSWIQLKRNGIQIHGEGIENLLVNMVLWKKNFRKTHFQKTQFHGKMVEGVGLKNWSIENTKGSNLFPFVSGVIN